MTLKRVIMHCNAGAVFGMGHLMRCLSLGQLAERRGWLVSLVGDIDETGAALVSRLLPSAELVAATGSELAARFEAALHDGVELVHLDSYWEVPPMVVNVPVSNMQDGPYGVRQTDLAIDANFGAENWFGKPELSTYRLVGIDAAVVREQVLKQRDTPVAKRVRPRLLVVMGGTDPNALTARVIESLNQVDIDLDVTVVSPRSGGAMSGPVAESRHRVEVLGFVEDLPALARQHDFAITAAGTTVWDFSCMGLPMGLVCAVDNQQLGYRSVVEAGMAIGLGEPPHDDLAARIAGLGQFLNNPDYLAGQREVLRRTVDGLGAWRIVSAWEQLVDAKQTAFALPLTVRPAALEDARTLFGWRNDEATRRASRSSEIVSWSSHCDWLKSCLSDPGRRLLVVLDQGEPVATVRWDHRGGTDWEVSITISPARRGQRLGASVLAAGEAALVMDGPVRMLAGIHVDNAASRRLFVNAGYLAQLPPDERGFEMRAKWKIPVD